MFFSERRLTRKMFRGKKKEEEDEMLYSPHLDRNRPNFPLSLVEIRDGEEVAFTVGVNADPEGRTHVAVRLTSISSMIALCSYSCK